MMRFRKKFRRRVKRPGMIMLPLSLCDEQETWSKSSNQCVGEGRVVAVQLHPGLQGNEFRPVALVADPNRPQALIQQTMRHSLTVRGIRFYWSLGVNEVLENQDAEVIHEVRLGVFNLETDAIGSPVFLPNLWSEYGPDQGDCLWRGFATMYQPQLVDPGTTTADGFGFSGRSLGFRGMCGCFYGMTGQHTEPVQIKTARRLGENNAIFLVYSVKNNVPVGEDEPVISTTLNLFGVAAVRSNAR